MSELHNYIILLFSMVKVKLFYGRIIKMKYPSFLEERKFWRKGKTLIIGIDEVGRGPLAGPVVAAAVLVKPILRSQFPAFFANVKDSKQLTAKKREEIYALSKQSSFIEWGIGKVSEKVIDKINIFSATQLAMLRAEKNLGKKLNRMPDFLILDGRIKINSPIPQKSIVKADEKVFSCALASIIAKVVRDRIMTRYDKKYPKYDFAANKGYGTKGHFKALLKQGPCLIHRKSFRPMRRA